METTHGRNESDKMTSAVRFLVVGTGWRADFFPRLDSNSRRWTSPERSLPELYYGAGGGNGARPGVRLPRRRVA